MKRSNDHSRLLRPQGNRASLQRHSKAQVALIRKPGDHETAALAPTDAVTLATPLVSKRWRRRKNTH